MKDREAEVFYYEWGITRWLTSRTRMQLDCAGRSIYRELLDLAYAQGSIPKDPEFLVRYCGCTREEWERSWPIISRHFHADKHDREQLLNDSATVFRRNFFAYRRQQKENAKKGGRAKNNPINNISADGKPSGRKKSEPPECPNERTNLTNEPNLTNERTNERKGAALSEFPETAAAVRKYFRAADDAIVTVIAHEALRAYVSTVNGHSAPPLTDSLIAEAVHEAHFPKQTSAGLFREKVPRVVKTWAEEAIRNGSIR